MSKNITTVMLSGYGFRVIKHCIKAEQMTRNKTDTVPGLHHTTPSSPGFTRKKKGNGFVFYDDYDGPLKDKKQLARLKKLYIPPAWTNVWICKNPNGHLQATGVDTRGRKQYIYHSKWRAYRDATKYHRMVNFGKALPKIRRRASKDMKDKRLTKEKVLAAIIQLLEASLIRVGNEEYAKQNNSFGLTTMRDQHARIKGGEITFNFLGKSKKTHSITLRDRRLAKIVKSCRDLPGQILFQYLDEEGGIKHITSGDVNNYIKEACGEDFTAKDFRTWSGTVLAALALKQFEKVDSEAQAKRNVSAAIESVAKKLGNTPTICKKCYVHPLILNAYMDGNFVQVMAQLSQSTLKKSLHHLKPEESVVLAYLQRELAGRSNQGRLAI